MVFERVKAADADALAGISGFVGMMIRFDADKKEVVVDDTIAESPARKVGLKKGAVILKIDGTAPDSLVSAVNIIRQNRPGTEVALTIRRTGRESEVKLKAGVVPFFYLD